MPSIKEKLEKSKGLLLHFKNTWFFVGICLVLGVITILGSFRLSTLLKDKNAFNVRVVEAAFETDLSGKEGSYVGSKTGKTYYFPWCGMVKRIKDSNLVWFPSRISAEASGYKASSNCNGLK